MGDPYIVTLDQAFRDARSVNVREEPLHYFHSSLLRDLADIVGDDLIAIRASEMNEALAVRAYETASHMGAHIMSMVHDPTAGLDRSLRVSRRVVLTSGGCENHPELVQRVSPSARTPVTAAKVVLVDDGAFTGGTVIAAMNELESLGQQAVAVVVGVLTRTAREHIESNAGRDLPIVALHEYPAVQDWVCSRDFIPFAADCGRQVAGTAAADGTVVPVISGGATRHCIPYLLPYVPDARTWQAWTGLPSNEARTFSRRRLEEALLFFNRVESRMTRALTSEDVASATRGASVPDLGSASAPNLNSGPVEVLPHLEMTLATLGPKGSD